MRIDDPALVSFAAAFTSEVALDASASSDSDDAALTRRLLETLLDVGEVEEASICELRRRGVEASGFGVEDGDTLNLFLTIGKRSPTPETVTRSEIGNAFRRMEALWERCRDGPFHESFDEHTDEWSMAFQIHGAASSIRRLRLHVLTDGVAAVEFIPTETVAGVEIRRSVWDLARVFRLEAAGSRGEPIEIHFPDRFGAPLPCLPIGVPGADYRAYLASFPGEWLADIYEQFGSRLLEKNVRSFLQFTGKVNRGMRDTISTDPPRFFAYNNGISATASAVELATLPDGSRGIVRLLDLQIVNGGQTTASLHRSRRSKVDVSSIAVQAKITEIDGDRLDEIVPLISQFANSQNKVSLADLSSNDPFHIEIESLSRSVWAEPTEKTMRQTRWFYERARGQYADALAREGTPARRRTFREVHPTSQKITKTDLAKFENTWAQRPWEVSQGAQKNFTAFMLAVHRRGPVQPDVAHFQRLVAKAILFRRAERIVSAQDFGGYRANIVAYALAKLSNATQQRLDLGAIWKTQELDQTLETAIGELSHMAFRLLTSEERASANVTEWAKREACWKKMQAIPWQIPDELRGQLVMLGPKTAQAKSSPVSSVMEGALPEHDPLVQAMSAIPGDAFLAIANWAKETDNLTTWQRRFSYSIGVQLNKGRQLSTKQAPHAEEVLAAARELGFDPLAQSSTPVPP